jgi:L-rhamnose mutarotase
MIRLSCLFMVLLYSCKDNVSTMQKDPIRIGSVTGIHPDKIDYYKKLHAETWPGVLKKIEEVNIRNYSIYLKEIDQKFYLFSYYEYYGNNYEADMKKMAEDSVTQRWWKETDPCQIPLPEAAALNQIWAPMEQVFFNP